MEPVYKEDMKIPGVTEQYFGEKYFFTATLIGEVNGETVGKMSEKTISINLGYSQAERDDDKRHLYERYYRTYLEIKMIDEGTYKEDTFESELKTFLKTVIK